MGMSEAEPLTDEQRIDVLEHKVGKNRTVITIMAITLIISLSVSFTVMILNLLLADEEYVPIETHEKQAALIQTLQEDIKGQQALIEQLTLTYEKSQVATFQEVLIEQEQSYQEFLSTMKLGMYDLAKMVQGSRTWLEIYNEKLEDAERLSLDREKRLKRVVVIE
jgi:hypothetical protein